MGTHPGSFSGGEYWRWTSWAKADSDACVLEAVLWILNTGAQWHMLPQSYPNYKTVHRPFQTWYRDEVLRRLLLTSAFGAAMFRLHMIETKAAISVP